MDSFIVNIGAAIWLGILTSISPCPLATNIAAISYVGRRVEKTRLVLAAGLLYTAGRALAYTCVAVLVTQSLQMIPSVSMFLQKYMNLFIGPLLIGVGVLLTGVLNLSFGGAGVGNRMEERVNRMGVMGAAFLGIVFALAFCPVSAGLFFGALVPLALKSNTIWMSSLFGVGTALPVIAFAIILAFSAHMIGAAFKKLTTIDLWARRITSAAMIIIGLYLTLRHNFGMGS